MALIVKHEESHFSVFKDEITTLQQDIMKNISTDEWTNWNNKVQQDIKKEEGLIVNRKKNRF